MDVGLLLLQSYIKNELIDTISTLNDKNTHRDWMICFAVWCYNMYTDLIKETTDTKREIQTHRKEKKTPRQNEKPQTDKQQYTKQNIEHYRLNNTALTSLVIPFALITNTYKKTHHL